MSDTASEIARLRAALAASEARAEAAESELAQTGAVVSTSEAMIKHLKLKIARLRREQYGHGLERRARLIDQMELQLEELEAAATEDEIPVAVVSCPPPAGCSDSALRRHPWLGRCGSGGRSGGGGPDGHRAKARIAGGAVAHRFRRRLAGAHGPRPVRLRAQSPDRHSKRSRARRAGQPCLLRVRGGCRT